MSGPAMPFGLWRHRATRLVSAGGASRRTCATESSHIPDASDASVAPDRTTHCGHVCSSDAGSIVVVRGWLSVRVFGVSYVRAPPTLAQFVSAPAKSTARAQLWGSYFCDRARCNWSRPSCFRRLRAAKQHPRRAFGERRVHRGAGANSAGVVKATRSQLTPGSQIRTRPQNMRNPRMRTGDIEVVASTVHVLNTCLQTLPLPVRCVPPRESSMRSACASSRIYLSSVNASRNSFP